MNTPVSDAADCIDSSRVAVLRDAASSLPLDRWYKRYRGELCAYLRHRGGLGPLDPEDIAQATFARLATIVDASIQHPRSFLYATARNLVSDYRRRQRRQDSHAEDTLRLAHHESLDELTPERVLIDREQLGILFDAMATLSPQRRDILLLSRYEGLPYAEIATRLGLTSSCVQKHVERALAVCRHMMREPGDANDQPGCSSRRARR